MKTLKLIISFILIVSLFLSVTACTPSPFDISDKEKEEFENAYFERYFDGKWKDQFEIVYMNEEMYGAGVGKIVCYGKFCGYIIYSHSASITQNTIQLCLGEFFFFASLYIDLLAYKDGVFYSVEQLYNDGLLTDEDIKDIHEIYWIARGAEPLYRSDYESKDY